MAPIPSYFDTADAAGLARDYPIGEDFLATFSAISADELRALQERRFRRLMERAWQIPFYRRLWGGAGIEAGDVLGLDHIARLPTYDKADLMESIAAHPPWGDFHGMEAMDADDRPPVILHTTSGTTGTPQVLLFGPKSRELQNLMVARLYRLQGLRPEDVVHSVYGHGLINGGHYIREAFVHWTNSIFLSAGTGIETRSVEQVRLMKDFGVTVLVGFADYIMHLADVARDEGLVPGEDIGVRMISGHMGSQDKAALAAAWAGAQVFDWYGVGDTGAIAGEGPDHAGLYVMEDAHYLEICDIDSGAPVEAGGAGDMVVTVLFKDDVYPIVRFCTHDVSRFEIGASPLGLNLRRIEGFLGRSDNMIKLRGVTVFPQAVGAVLGERPEFGGEFLCRAVHDASGRDEMIVTLEIEEPAQAADLEPLYRDLLRHRLGVDVEVELVAPGALAPITGIEARQKPIRLIDERPGGTLPTDNQDSIK
jgi:phenylacetate-CoA ligase